MFPNISSTNFSSTIKSQIAICPKCKNDCRIINNGFFIQVKCKFCHESNYSLKEFEQGQYRPIKQIKCGNNCKHEGTENNFFYCLNCKIDLCNFCKNHHFNSDIENNSIHTVVKYEQKNYFCPQHFERFNNYCNDCDKNICFECENFHKEHKTQYFDLNLSERNIKLEKLKQLFDKMRIIFDNSKNLMNSFFNGINDIFEIIFAKIYNYGKIRIWQELVNQNAYDIDYFIQELQKIANITDTKNEIINFFVSLIKLYEKMYNPNSSNLKNEKPSNISIKKEIDFQLSGKKYIKKKKNISELKNKNKKINSKKLIKVRNNKSKEQLITNKFNQIIYDMKNSRNSYDKLSNIVLYSNNITNKNKIKYDKMSCINYQFFPCSLLKYNNTMIARFKKISVEYLKNIFSNCISFQEQINNKKLYLPNLNNNFENTKSIIEKDLKEFHIDEFPYLWEREIVGLSNYINYFLMNENDDNSQLLEFSSISDNKSKSEIKNTFKDFINMLPNYSEKNKTNIIILNEVNKSRKDNNKNKYKKIIKAERIRKSLIKLKYIKMIFYIDDIDLYFIKNIFKYFSNNDSDNFGNTVLYLLSVIPFILSSDSNYNFMVKLYSLLKDIKIIKFKYGNICIFSSINERKNVYIKFLINCIMIFIRGKGGTMITFNYPYGYIFSNIIFKYGFDFFLNFISFKK